MASPSISEILSKTLFVGNLAIAESPKELKQRGITHILSVTSESYLQYPGQFVYLVLPILDDYSQRIVDLFEQAHRFIGSVIHLPSDYLSPPNFPSCSFILKNWKFCWLISFCYDSDAAKEADGAALIHCRYFLSPQYKWSQILHVFVMLTILSVLEHAVPVCLGAAPLPWVMLWRSYLCASNKHSLSFAPGGGWRIPTSVRLSACWQVVANLTELFIAEDFLNQLCEYEKQLFATDSSPPYIVEHVRSIWPDYTKTLSDETIAQILRASRFNHVEILYNLKKAASVEVTQAADSLQLVLVDNSTTDSSCEPVQTWCRTGR